MLVGRVEEQMQLGAATRSALQRVCTEADVRRLMSTERGYDDPAWSALGAMGATTLLIPESVGGGGASLIELGVVVEELGRRLYPGPYLPTAVLAVTALLHAIDSKPLLKQIADGATATLAVTESSALWAPEDMRCRAQFRDGQWYLEGVKNWVPDGASVELILVVADTGDGHRFFAVDPQAAGLTRTALPTMDQTRKQALLQFAATPAQQLSLREPTWEVLRRVERAGMAALAADQVGGAQEVLALVLAHVTSRHQFGRPIGTFQAVQHKCADMALDIEAARSAAYYAAMALATGADDAAEAAEVAKSYCSEMYRRVTAAAMQVFGGISMTWEHPIHLYFKRARSSEVLFGSPAQHRERLATMIGL